MDVDRWLVHNADSIHAEVKQIVSGDPPEEILKRWTLKLAHAGYTLRVQPDSVTITIENRSIIPLDRKATRRLLYYVAIPLCALFLFLLVGTDSEVSPTAFGYYLTLSLMAFVAVIVLGGQLAGKSLPTSPKFLLHLSPGSCRLTREYAYEDAWSVAEEFNDLAEIYTVHPDPINENTGRIRDGSLWATFRSASRVPVDERDSNLVDRQILKHLYDPEVLYFVKCLLRHYLNAEDIPTTVRKRPPRRRRRFHFY